MVEASFWEAIRQNISVAVVDREEGPEYHFHNFADDGCAIGRTFKYRSRAEATIHWPKRPRVTARRVLFDRGLKGAADRTFPLFSVRVDLSEWGDDEHERRHSKHWGEGYKAVVKRAGQDEVITGDWSSWSATKSAADREAEASAFAAAIIKVNEAEREVNRRFRELTSGGRPDWPYSSDVLEEGFQSVLTHHQ